MSLFQMGGVNYMPASDVDAVASWYCQKLEMERLKIPLDDCDDCVALGFEQYECAVVIGRPGRDSGELVALLFTHDVNKAREFLISRGVQVGEIRQDEQGTRLFEMRDPEGNVIEISEEP